MLKTTPLDSCQHASLCLASSSYAEETGYRRPTAQQRDVATKADSTKRKPSNNDVGRGGVDSSSFPAPLVLPGDELALDPRYPTQSVRSWLCLKERNEVTTERRIIYVAAPPKLVSGAEFMRAWTVPHMKKHGKKKPAVLKEMTGETDGSESKAYVNPPRVEDVINYLSAFYCGIPVKLLSPSQPLSFTTWDDAKSSAKTQHDFVALNTKTESIRIRTRKSPDGTYTRQLNLDDLLDCAISVLPDDAYALQLLVHHDLYEDDDDEFVCGRAYGGSRVSIVSTARYHPGLDLKTGVEVERLHAWPASHCEDYVTEYCASAASHSKSRKMKAAPAANYGLGSSTNDQGPLQAAVAAHAEIQLPSSSAELSSLWLARIARTTSHELGHCFGIDHCMYYACVMQGSASLAEDARQPPYLCPVDEAKLERATGTGRKGRYKMLAAFCNQHKDAHMFAALGAWIRKRLVDVESEVEDARKRSRLEG